MFFENIISDSEQHQFAGPLIKKGEKRYGGCAKTICRTSRDIIYVCSIKDGKKDAERVHPAQNSHGKLFRNDPVSL